MEIMTWKEFKEQVDRQLAEQGISEDTPIQYIDLSFPIKNSELITENGGPAGIAIRHGRP